MTLLRFLALSLIAIQAVTLGYFSSAPVMPALAYVLSLIGLSGRYRFFLKPSGCLIAALARQTESPGEKL